MCYISIKEDLISVKVCFTKHFFFCFSFIKKVNLRKTTFNLIPPNYLFNTFSLKGEACFKK